MKKLLFTIYFVLGITLAAQCQELIYYFDIAAPGHVTPEPLKIIQSGSDYTVVNLDDFCSCFLHDFLLNGEYDHSKWSTDEHNVIEYYAQEGLVGIKAYFSKKTNSLERIEFFDDCSESSCVFGGEYSPRKTD
jgi:hypothetical protein